MSENEIILNNICAVMHAGAHYPTDAIKQLYMKIFNNEEESKLISKVLASESRKKNGLISKSGKGSYTYYTKNDDVDINATVFHYEQAKLLATIIKKSLDEKTIQTLNQWFHDDLEAIIYKMITETIKSEIRDELVPVIEFCINDKMSKHMDKFRQKVVNVLTDDINANQDGG